MHLSYGHVFLLISGLFWLMILVDGLELHGFLQVRPCVLLISNGH
jgi:hypothetical protein